MSLELTYTLCFYEYPAASGDIDTWEEKFKGYIIKKKDSDPIRTFVLKKKNDNIEVVVCAPMNTEFFDDVQGFERYIRAAYLDCHDLICVIDRQPKYLKTVVFGRTTVQTLISIITITNTYEKVERKFLEELQCNCCR